MTKTRANFAEGRGGAISPRRRRLGMSIVEVLIVLALLAMVVAMVMPVWSGWRTDTEFESLKREIGAELASARVTAMRDGVAQRVTIRDGAKLVRSAWSGPPKSDDSGSPLPSEGIATGTEFMTLPAGYTLGPAKVADDSATTDSPRPEEPAETKADPDKPADTGVTLVLFLPDGTVAASRADWRLVLTTRGKQTRQERLRIDTWTGGTQWEVIQEIKPSEVPNSEGDASEGGAA